MNLLEFQNELRKLINKYSMENVTNIPDYIIAEYLINCYVALNRAINIRDRHYDLQEKGKL